MAMTYSWADLVAVAIRFIKNPSVQNISPQICDLVSSDMHVEYPWKQTITNTASAKIPLIDSVQDYSVEAPNIMRPVKAWFRRSDVLPIQTRDLEIKKDISVNLIPLNWQAIRTVSLQQSVGLFRLESAVQIPAGVQIELCFDYQANPIKVAGLSQIIWFDDRYVSVPFEGLLYYMYKLGDDSRAGSATVDATGKVIGYSGQLAIYKAALNRMKSAEEGGFTENVFPADVMGEGRDWTSYWIVG